MEGEESNLHLPTVGGTQYHRYDNEDDDNEDEDYYDEEDAYYGRGRGLRHNVVHLPFHGRAVH
jgi:hypothetical protein